MIRWFVRFSRLAVLERMVVALPFVSFATVLLRGSFANDWELLVSGFAWATFMFWESEREDESYFDRRGGLRWLYVISDASPQGVRWICFGIALFFFVWVVFGLPGT
ncbi:MAG: hypothetical protein AAF517_11510 [Planctomycetota bacterium]